MASCSLPIEQRILHYFLAMGAQQNSPLGMDGSSLSFTLGNDKLIVNILTANDIVQRNRILEVLLHLASFRGALTQLYVVAPRLLGASLDAQIFRSHGIGLLLFDERRIEETIKPQPFFQNSQSQVITATPDPTVLSELATLKSMYSQMERALEDIRAEFTSIKQNSEDKAPGLERDTTGLVFEPVMGAPSLLVKPADDTLPPFFANNPWLDVLSRRGRSEVAPLAG
ncbi:MAG TPA: hypothetical protein VK503_05980 [Candidatus Bathyarchaeia archaeon]|nr:hypothetical protein [Candidatus Bathyarchaeia archaeon]